MCIFNWDKDVFFSNYFMGKTVDTNPYCTSFE